MIAFREQKSSRGESHSLYGSIFMHFLFVGPLIALEP
jgi:hypothetical protein